MKVTTVILARNEEKHIENAIHSATAISESILVIDNESTDATVSKAKAAGATVLSHPLNNDFAQQRNWALEQVNTDWVLFLDADEEISPALLLEIQKLNEEKYKDITAFFIPRYDYWQGKELTFGEVHNASSKGFARLVHKGTGQWEGAVHETWKPKSGTEEQLRNPLRHYPHPTVHEFLEEINYYSTVRAKELYKAKTPVSVFQIWAYPLGKFIMSYFILFGFLHGSQGFVYSFMMSFHSFLVRSKLYQYYHLSAPEV